MTLALLLALAALGANVQLYMKDGSSHLVREYQLQPDRVRYFSVERSEWEEVPVELVDLKRTEKEIKQRSEAQKEDAVAQDAEEKALRAQRREAEQVPQETGAFWVQEDKVKVLKQAEMKVVNNKRRSILKAMSPIPVVAGKSTVELDGLKSPVTIPIDRPDFYIRLAAEERFGILRLKPGKLTRLVQTWNILPITKEVVEESDTVEIFRKQIADGLYKIWPIKPLEPGEYAVVEFTEGKGNIQVWDFTVVKP
ncbi:MAG: hypothetical protein ABI822_09480 [Bryobacteraceae bacterium]